MADYKAILRLRPSYGEFLAEDLRHRGDVLVFAPRHRSDAFTTDGQGFRHTTFRGDQFSVAKIMSRPRYGVVLGTSRVFGYGLSGNDKTIPSLLSQRLGFPFANVALPQGNSRNLASLLQAFVARAPRPPTAVVHFSTGDFTGLAFSSTSDPVFGSPNLKQFPIAAKERGGFSDTKPFVRPMLAFTSLWTQVIASICRAHSIPLILAHDSSFFEKAVPSPSERECRLGTPYHQVHKRWFATHEALIHQFYEHREALAARLNLPLIGPGRSNDLGFIDEFHYDEDGARAMADDLASALEPLLAR